MYIHLNIIIKHHKKFIFIISSFFSILYSLTKSSSLDFVVGLSGLEPPTSRLSGVRSNLLSYRPALGLRRVLCPFSSFSSSYSSFNVQCISFVHWKMNSVPSLYRPFRLSSLKTQVLLLCSFGYFLTYSTCWRIPDFTP